MKTTTKIGVMITMLGLLAGSIQADLLMIGNTGGEVFGRDEFDLGTHIPASYINYGTPITALAGGRYGDVAIGIGGAGINVSMRPIDQLVVVNTSVTTGSGATALARRPNGSIAIGDAGNLVFVRDRSNLTLLAPDWTGGSDGLNFNNGITAIGTLSNGDLVIGNLNGEVFVRRGTDLTLTAVGATVGYINYGSPITALAVTPTDDIVIGFSSGLVDTRALSDISISLSSVNFGLGITALGALSNGRVAIGLDNGSVDVRPALSLPTYLGISATFTGAGEDITAIAVSSHDDLGVGTANNLVFIRRGDNLGLTPVGFVGADGLNFNTPISALTFAVPEPATIGLLSLGGLLLLARRRCRLS